MRKTVLICQMGYRGEPQVQVSDSIMTEVAHMMGNADCGVSYFSISGSCMLPHLRNRAVALFKASPATDLIMIDDDNWIEPGGLTKLIQNDEDVVAVPIRVKVPPPEVKWNYNPRLDRPMRREENGLMEVENAGTGIIRISRRCVERMIEADPDSWYFDKDSPDGKAWALFEYPNVRFNKNKWHGEDLTFCNKWKAMGGKIWVLPEVRTYHMGKTVFEGCLSEYLASMPPTATIHEGDSGEIINVVNNEFSKGHDVGLPMYRKSWTPEPSPPVLIDHNGQLPVTAYQNGSGAGLG